MREDATYIPEGYYVCGHLNRRQILLTDAFQDRHDGINHPFYKNHIREYIARKFLAAADRGFKPGFDPAAS